jgi:hypothetical protein
MLHFIALHCSPNLGGVYRKVKLFVEQSADTLQESSL